MTREIDLAVERHQAETDQKIEEIRSSARKRELIATGSCHYCGERVKANELFCAPIDDDGDGCQRDYEREQTARRLAGR